MERGVLHVVHRGVYAPGHCLLTAEGRWMAAVLVCGSGAVLSHRSAGRLWRVLPSAAGWTEVTMPEGWRPRPGITRHRSLLPADETAVVDGIPVTSVSRTLLDLAAVLSRRQLERALNEAEVLELTDRLSLPDLLERYPRRRGSAALRALLGDGEALRGITRSELEERFVSFIDAHGLPRPRLNADLAVRGRFFEVDCLWHEQRLIVELDGRASHGTGRAFERDRERDRLLLAEGWRVIRITWRQLRDDAPGVLADLRRLLRSPVAPLPA
jgi:very-short-patch-repair endonuclease